MSLFKMGICYHPTSVVLVDDNENFLSQIYLNLSAKQLPVYFFTDPLRALGFVGQEYQPDPFTNHCITSMPDRDADNFSASFDIRKIHHEIYNAQRHAQITVLVVDYAMPTINGKEFCEAVDEDFALKLILTGNAGLAVAVAAFNEGIIDMFLQKGDAHLPLLLYDGIIKLQQKYFLKLSEAALYKGHQQLYAQAPACLSDVAFVKFFRHLCEQNNICEYYLLDESGSFLLLDHKATPGWLVVKSERELNELYEFAAEQDAPAKIQHVLQHKIMVPYFHTDKELGAPFAESYHCFHPAERLEGKQVYYYAHVKNPDAYPLDRENILSFDDYFESV